MAGAGWGTTLGVVFAKTNTLFSAQPREAGEESADQRATLSDDHEPIKVIKPQAEYRRRYTYARIWNDREQKCLDNKTENRTTRLVPNKFLRVGLVCAKLQNRLAVIFLQHPDTTAEPEPPACNCLPEISAGGYARKWIILEQPSSIILMGVNLFTAVVIYLVLFTIIRKTRRQRKKRQPKETGFRTLPESEQFHTEKARRSPGTT